MCWRRPLRLLVLPCPLPNMTEVQVGFKQSAVNKGLHLLHSGDMKDIQLPVYFIVVMI